MSEYISSITIPGNNTSVTYDIQAKSATPNAIDESMLSAAVRAKLAQAGAQGASNSSNTLAQYGAVGNGEIDDLEALNTAFLPINADNSVIDGGNKVYKTLGDNSTGNYLKLNGIQNAIIQNIQFDFHSDIWMNELENVTFKNVCFRNGPRVLLVNSKHVSFINCTWEHIHSQLITEGENAGYYKDQNTAGIALAHRGASPTVSLTNAAQDHPNEYCEYITFDHCYFNDIWYNQKQYRVPTDADAADVAAGTYDGYENANYSYTDSKGVVHTGQAPFLSKKGDRGNDSFPRPNEASADCMESYPHTTTGYAIFCAGYDNLFVKNCFFTQIKGNGAIAHNCTPGKCGYAEITDNTFYLLGFSAFNFYAATAIKHKIRRKLCDNMFIGCGLGYMPWDYLWHMKWHERGVGCAALLGGNTVAKMPYRGQFLTLNNNFQDNVESSIEGAIWNPCLNNTIYGQGCLQTEENCQLMKEKYNLSYDLEVRPNPSWNYIYRNYGQNQDGSFYAEDDEWTIYDGNTMGQSYMDAASLIMLQKSTFNTPVVFTNNRFIHPKGEKLYTHFYKDIFKKDVIMKNNEGIEPYFNSCTIEGGLELDNIAAGCGYKSDFSKANLILKNTEKNQCFPELKIDRYDSSTVTLNNKQAYIKDGYVTLKYEDLENNELENMPRYMTVDPVYNIAYNPKYDTNNKYFNFEGRMNGDYTTTTATAKGEYIDTGFDPSQNNAWTILIETTGWNIPAAQIEEKYGKGNSQQIISLLTSNFLDFGSMWKGVQDECAIIKTGENETGKSFLPIRRKKNSQDEWVAAGDSLLRAKHCFWVIRYENKELKWYLRTNDENKDTLEEYYIEHLTKQIPNDFTIPAGNFFISADSTIVPNRQEFFGYVNQLKIYNEALDDYSLAMFLTKNKNPMNKDNSMPLEDTLIYNIQDNPNYSFDQGYMLFDGNDSAFIPKNKQTQEDIKLFADDSNWTIIVEFQFDSFKGRELPNYTFVPVLSCMEDAEVNPEDNTKIIFDKFKPGIDLGLSLKASGTNDLSATSSGGFIQGRNSWQFDQYVKIDTSCWSSYNKNKYTVIIQRKNGVVTYYSGTLDKYGQITSDITGKIFNKSLVIGGPSAQAYLSKNINDNRDLNFEGKIYDLRIYNKAISIADLDSMNPNTVSNASKAKGTAQFAIVNKNPQAQIQAQYIAVDIWYELSKYAETQYATTYPKLANIKIKNKNFWIGAGTSQHKRIFFYDDTGTKLKPFKSLNIEIGRTGQGEGCEITILGIKANILGRKTILEDQIDATILGLNWEGDVVWSDEDQTSLILTANSQITAKLNFLNPEFEEDNPNVGIEPIFTFESKDGAEVSYDYDPETQELVLSGTKQSGSGMFCITLPSGFAYMFEILIEGDIPAQSFEFEENSIEIKTANKTVKNKITYIPENANQNLKIQYTCEDDNDNNIIIAEDGTVSFNHEVNEDTDYTIKGQLINSETNELISGTSQTYTITLKNNIIQEWNGESLIANSSDTFENMIIDDGFANRSFIIPQANKIENAVISLTTSTLPENDKFKIVLKGLYTGSADILKTLPTSQTALAAIETWGLETKEFSSWPDKPPVQFTLLDEQQGRVWNLAYLDSNNNSKSFIRFGAFIRKNGNSRDLGLGSFYTENSTNILNRIRLMSGISNSNSTKKVNDIEIVFDIPNQTITTTIYGETNPNSAQNPVIVAMSDEQSREVLNAIKGKSINMSLLQGIGLGIESVKIEYC